MDQLYKFSAKQIGIILIAIALALSILFVFTTRALMDSAALSCAETCGQNGGTCGMGDGACPHTTNIPLQSYLGFTVCLILAGIGVFMILSGGKFSEEITEKEKKLEKVTATLQGDERAICEAIQKSGGAMFQSELIEQTGLNKVKVSRVLDKLEGKGLIERRRRGMTNLVLLK